MLSVVPDDTAANLPRSNPYECCWLRSACFGYLADRTGLMAYCSNIGKQCSRKLWPLAAHKPLLLNFGSSSL
jgi:hypothetical protein